MDLAFPFAVQETFEEPRLLPKHVDQELALNVLLTGVLVVLLGHLEANRCVQ